MRRAVMTGLGTYVPERILSNHDLERMVDTNDEWIVSRTGIRERRMARNDEATSDMAVHAAERALDDAGLSADDLDFILMATNTPDTVFPSTAARLQARLSERPIAGVDLQAGCTGWVYGLAMAASMIEAGVYRRILVVASDKLSSITDYEDRSTAVLFGDGAGAVVLEAMEDSPYGILSSYLNADGRGADLLALPAGGSRWPASKDTVDSRLHFLKMSGNEVFRFAVKAMPDAVEQGLARAGLTVQDIDLLIPHQANQRIIEAAMRHFDLPSSKVIQNIERYGNTSVASIPLAMDEARQEGRLQNGSLMVLAAFGAGLTWGSVVARWGGCQ
ncbi:beta-ketoacyl-ACP synthase III [Sulfobacillus harzensis]|uniref:beta-ketoacyl-ACP synthase III n=1 Tax=Sulfobacillus harzensis TaxID=2729629 RepID=UPI001A9A8AC9|nr:beta-ketoacyl-ACP synthase III [Sulfobacillus harzensis]